MEAHILKLPKTVCGLAMLFALVDGEQGGVGYDSTCRALSWVPFLRSHAERLYGAVSGAAVAGAKLILQRRDRLPAPFKVKQVKQKGWAGLDTTEAVQDALDVLEEHGHLYAIETPTPGRPRILKPFGIKSKDVRIGPDVKRGYLLKDFEDAFKRYLSPGTPSQSATTRQVNKNSGLGGFSTATAEQRVADENSHNPLNYKGCSAVADKTTPLSGKEEF